MHPPTDAADEHAVVTRVVPTLTRVTGRRFSDEQVITIELNDGTFFSASFPRGMTIDTVVDRLGELQRLVAHHALSI